MQVMAGPRQRGEKPQKQKAYPYDAGVSYGVISVILAIAGFFPIPLWLKALLLPSAVCLCFVFFHKSPWTHAWSLLWRNVSATALVFLLGAIGIPPRIRFAREFTVKKPFEFRRQSVVFPGATN